MLLWTVLGLVAATIALSTLYALAPDEVELTHVARRQKRRRQERKLRRLRRKGA